MTYFPKYYTLFTVAIVSMLLMINVERVLSQQAVEVDSLILHFLFEEHAFLLWQENWKKRLPEFNLTAFKFKEEKKLTEQFKDSTSIEKFALESIYL